MKESKRPKNLDEIREEVVAAKRLVDRIRREVGSVIIGQQHMIDCLLIGLLTDSHILLEGAPGLAKTLAIRTLASAMELKFQRIQFTPDLLPADLIGTEIYSPKTGSFSTRKGPVFTNVLLADEINRAPPKVQSALLEAMGERQVTIGGDTMKLPRPFLVLATQNPLEQEGTYPLPEAQADRFMMKVIVEYPSQSEEKQILLQSKSRQRGISPVANAKELMHCRRAMAQIRMDELIVDYIIAVVRATRDPAGSNIPIGRFVEFGASPRASLSMMDAARAHAFLRGRAFVTPDDVKAIGIDVLRHRLLLTYEAEAEGLSPDWIVQQIFRHLRTP